MTTGSRWVERTPPLDPPGLAYRPLCQPAPLHRLPGPWRAGWLRQLSGVVIASCVSPSCLLKPIERKNPCKSPYGRQDQGSRIVIRSVGCFQRPPFALFSAISHDHLTSTPTLPRQGRGHWLRYPLPQALLSSNRRLISSGTDCRRRRKAVLARSDTRRAASSIRATPPR